MAIVSIGNQVIFVAKWMRLPREGHKPGTILVHPRVHGLVYAIHPRWRVLLLVVKIEGINQMPHLVEPVCEEDWCLLVGVLDGSRDITETPI
jgi:hypothetical protein